jgi:hypothetical protein
MRTELFMSGVTISSSWGNPRQGYDFDVSRWETHASFVDVLQGEGFRDWVVLQAGVKHLAHMVVRYAHKDLELLHVTWMG